MTIAAIAVTWIGANAAAIGAVAAVAGAAVGVYSATQVEDAPDVAQIAAPQASGGQMAQDKTTALSAAKLEEAEIGDEESRKRKAAASKSKFKQARIPTEQTTGVKVSDSVTATPGVQI